MSGAESVGGYAERARQALAAGCDILLVCNNPDGADEVLESLRNYSNPVTQMRMIRLHGQQSHAQLFDGSDWNSACEELNRFNRRLGLAESGDLFE
jgi:beta-N-acetylhexosaminidase